MTVLNMLMPLSIRAQAETKTKTYISVLSNVLHMLVQLKTNTYISVLRTVLSATLSIRDEGVGAGRVGHTRDPGRVRQCRHIAHSRHGSEAHCGGAPMGMCACVCVCACASALRSTVRATVIVIELLFDFNLTM